MVRGNFFYDEDGGNVSATVEAYYSLLYSGYVSKDDSRMLAAKEFIKANGGLSNHICSRNSCCR